MLLTRAVLVCSDKLRWRGLLPRTQNALPGVDCIIIELFLNAKQLIVLCQALGARKRTGLDEPAVRRHGKIGDSGIFRFARTVRYHHPISAVLRHLDGFERLAQAADLVWLDKNCVGDAAGNTAFSPAHI